MIRTRWPGWRRDLLSGVLAAGLTAAVLVPLGRSAVQRERRQAEAAEERALEAGRLEERRAAEAREQAQRNLVEQAGRLLLDFQGDENKEAVVLHVTTAAVAPEVPRGAHLLIHKKTGAFQVGDIVAFRVEGNTWVGRVLAIDKGTGRLTVGRNGEANREVATADVIGRGLLNSR
jgi:hypothetical protein